MTASPEGTVIDLATRIQRRRDFGAHLSGYGLGLVVLVLTQILAAGAATTAVATGLTWAVALSFQHFRHVLFGPVTPADATAEATRLRTRRPETGPGQARESAQ